MTFYNNLVSIIEDASVEEYQDGLSWYAEAHEIARSLSDRYDISLEQAAGVIAVLSNSTRWAQNVAFAQKACLSWHDGSRVPVGLYHSWMTRKVYAILDGDLSQVKGPKVTPFYRNIVQDTYSDG